MSASFLDLVGGDLRRQCRSEVSGAGPQVTQDQTTPSPVQAPRSLCTDSCQEGPKDHPGYSPAPAAVTLCDLMP